MIKQLLILSLFLIAFARSGYVVQQMYPKEDTECKSPIIFANFAGNKHCVSVGFYSQKSSCNGTHVIVETSCNKDCSSCGSSAAYPAGKCITGFFGLKLTCTTKLPDIEKDGIYVQSYSNNKCVNKPHYINGIALSKGICQNSSSKGLLGVNFGAATGKSTKAYRDGKYFRIEDHDERDCKGSIIRQSKFKLDTCVLLPGPGYAFNNLNQPGQYAIFSTKSK